MNNRRISMVAGLGLLVTACGQSPPQANNAAASSTDRGTGPVPSVTAPPPVTVGSHPFGETESETQSRQLAEAEAQVRNAESKAQENAKWVGKFSVSQFDQPNGRRVGESNYGERLAIYQRVTGWVRINPVFAKIPLWVKATDLQDAEPPPKPAYSGDPAYNDPRIEAGAINNPGEGGTSKADADNLHKGAKLILDSRKDCGRVTLGEKADDGTGRYFITCGDFPTAFNVYFTARDVARARIP